MKIIGFVSGVIAKLSRSVLVFIFSLILCAVIFSRIVSDYYTNWDPDLGRHLSFYVAVAATQGPHPVELVSYRFAKETGRALVVPPNGLSIEIGDQEHQRFIVRSNADGVSVIETVLTTEDYVVYSRYFLKGEEIVPVMLKKYGPGHAMLGFLIAVPFCFIFFAILRFLFKGRTSEVA